MSGKELFYTRPAAEKGVRLKLVTPMGAPTEHWIEIRHTLSDAYRRSVVDQGRRHFLEIARIEDPLARREAEEDAKRTTVAALVLGWSFGEGQPSPAEVKEFLRDAPQIADQIAGAANDADLFFGERSPGSSTSPDMTSSSTDDQKEASAPSDSSTNRSGSNEG